MTSDDDERGGWGTAVAVRAEAFVADRTEARSTMVIAFALRVHACALPSGVR